MPWFCHSAPKKKRSSKTRVGGVGKAQQENNTLSEDRPTFAVVLQSFASSIGDELTVQRGQVVEVMYHDGDWTFVRNLDSGSGYIPKMYCLSMDKVKGDFNNTMLNHVSGPLPRPRVINVDTLQRSGSSVNSVEVHQVSSTTFLETSEHSEHTDTSTRTSSSSQVIYEVPKSPAQRFSGSASQPTPECMSEVTPPSTSRAPSLPPRSANLLTPAEIQRQQWAPPPTGPAHRPAYLPGCRQSNPFTVAIQGATSTQQSPKLQRSGSYRSTTGQSTALRQSHTSASLHHRSGQQQTTPPAPLTPHSAPLTMSQPHTLHNTENSPSSAPSSAKFSPGTSPSFNLGRRYSSQRGVVIGQSHPQMRGQFPPMEASDHVAATPGSAGAPVVAPSPISARFAVTPGSTPAVTPGCAAKPSRLAATPSGASAMDTNSQWPTRGAKSTPPTHNQRGQPRRFRRHSSDVVLLDSCISEDSNVVTYHSPPQTTARNHRARQSHPCVTELGVCSPPRRPTRLPVRRSLSMQDPRKHDQAVMTGESHTESGPIHRARSYQEAVLSEEEKRLGATASLKPSELIKQRAMAPGSESSDHQEQPCDSQGKLCGHRSNRGLEASTDPDDVFLPGTKKPFGIYKCTKAYQQKFKGEISLKKNELVIVLDQGKGEWAWAITSDNNEGLIPKSVLVQYHSDVGFAAFMGSLGRGRGKQRLDAGTQTEVDTCVGPDSNSVSCNDTGTSCSSVDRATLTGGDSVTIPPANRGREEADSASAVIEPSDAHSCPKEWFDTLDSVDAAKIVTRISMEREDDTHPTLSEATPKSHDQQNAIATSHNQGNGTTPTSSTQPSEYKAETVVKVSKIPVRPKMKKAASVQQSEQSMGNVVVTRPKSGARSVPTTPLSRDQGGLAASRIPVRPRMQKAASVPQPVVGRASASGNSGSHEPRQVKSGTVHYHDRISGIGSVNFESDSNITSPGSPLSNSHMGMRPSPLLTALKDYTPSDNSKNCLPLKKGDVLHLQPHMHYPKGWMWVWHTKRRSFGYVPKSYVAYTYDTPHRERKDTIEDAV